MLLTYYPYRSINNIKANQWFSPDLVQFRDAEGCDELLLRPLAHVRRADGVHRPVFGFPVRDEGSDADDRMVVHSRRIEPITSVPSKLSTIPGPASLRAQTPSN